MSSFGEELRRERELREISLREVSEATKINLRFLEAMERNDFDDLPGGVFNRGYVRAYCQFIGVDAEAMVNAYLLEEQARSESARSDGGMRLLRGTRRESPSTPPHEPEQRSSPSRGAQRLAFWIVAAAVLLVLAAVVVWVGVSVREHDPGGEAPAGSEGPSAARPRQ